MRFRDMIERMVRSAPFKMGSLLSVTVVKCEAVAVLILFSAVGQVIGAQSTPPQKTQPPESWTDPATGLIWAGKDNGKDVTWNKAVKYCRDLRLAGYSDWRLANMAELQGIYDRAANAPGLAGPHDNDPTMWHIKGNLFLTGYLWSSTDILDDRGKPSGYAFYFDFNEGKSNDDQKGYSTFKHALCVRGSGDPLGGQRQHP